MKHTYRTPAVLLAALFAAPALAAPVTPDAGSLMQQVAPKQAPKPSKGDTGLTRSGEPSHKAAPGMTFAVQQIQIEGNTLYDTTVLHALVADGEGQTLDLAGLQALAQRITDHYHNHGYSMSRAILPAQTIEDGIVRIQVIEGRHGKIKLNNHSRASDAVLQSTLSALQSGEIISDKKTSRTLLLLSDLPGVKSAATLKPGTEIGTADLDVNVEAAPQLSGTAQLDNYGNSYTGRARLNAAMQIAEPLHHGDQVSLNIMSSGSDMRYGRIAYDSLLTGNGTRLGGAYSALQYKLGGSLSNLLGHGTADVGSLWLSHPFVRSVDNNLNARLQYDSKQLRDRLDASSTRTDRHLGNWSATLSGDVRDGLKGYNAWSVGLTTGHSTFDDTAAAATDAASARSAGSFSKLSASYARLQGLSERNSLYLNLIGQWTNKNLDSAEKMSAGGVYSVRAYDMGVLSADEGYQASVELRHQINEQWQGKLFADTQQLRVNHRTWSAGDNSATLSGIGLGLDWHRNDWFANAYVASRAGSVPTQISSASKVRGWVQVGRQF